MNMEVRIREATLDDIEILDSLQNKLARYERNFDSGIRRKGKLRYRSLKNFWEAIKAKNTLVLIAEVKGQGIGCGFAEIELCPGNFLDHPKRAWITQVFVEKRYRGKGVGKKITEKLIHWLHKKKIYDIRLRVYTKNPAGETYKKYGFNDYIREMNYQPKEVFN